MRWLVAAGLSAVVVAIPAAAADFRLRLVSQTSSRITLGWDAQQNVVAYVFYADGKRVSHTFDGNRTSVTFAKVTGCEAECYAVEDLVSDGRSVYPAATPPPPPPKKQCEDGIDNDGDGKIDHPTDPGCAGPTDDDESNPPPTQTAITAFEFAQRCNVAGAVIDNVVVNGGGGIVCDRPNVTVRNSRLNNASIDIYPNANGFTLSNTDIVGGAFFIYGPDNITIEDGLFDGNATEGKNLLWDSPARDGIVGLTIRNNRFEDYRGSDCNTHGEALFIGGYTRDVLIENNTFFNNGCTAHIFISYFGTDGVNGYRSDGSQIPRNICIRGNDFQPRFLNTFFDVHHQNSAWQSQFGTSLQIRVDPDQNPDVDFASALVHC